jgi:hypothetical protein
MPAAILAARGSSGNLRAGGGSEGLSTGTAAPMIRYAVAALLALVSISVSAQALPGSPAPAETELDRKLATEDDTAALRTLAAQFRASGDVVSETSVWKRLVQLRPHLGQYKYELAAAYAQQDHKSHAYNALLELQAQGYAFDPRDDRRFAPVTTTEVWVHLLKAFDVNRQPFGEGELAHTLPGEDLLLESLAWDPTRKQLLVGSAREGAVHLLDSRGRLSPLVRASAENGLWAVFDIAVDAERGVLWVASTAVPHFRGYKAETDLGRAGVFKFDLKTGRFLKSYLSPTVLGQSFFMSSLALAPDGTVYAADGVNNAIYAVHEDRLRRVLHNARLGGIRGMAVSGDGELLYFADHERGIFGYELKTGTPFEVGVPKNLALGGIEGLFWWNGHLLVVQNGMVPRRVMRLGLAPGGRSIAGVQPLEANQPELSLPTQGTLAGDTLYLIANSQKFQYDRFGLPRDRSKLEAAKVYRVAADWALADAATLPMPGRTFTPGPAPQPPTTAPGVQTAPKLRPEPAPPQPARDDD